MQARKLIVAADVPDLEAAIALAQKTHEVTWGIKVESLLSGYESSAQVIGNLSAWGQVFADGKIHTNPRAAARIAGQYARQGATMATAHGSGGLDMVRATVQSFGEYQKATALGIVVVTALTGLSESTCYRSYGALPAETIERFAEIAEEAGAFGIVCAPLDLPPLKGKFLTLKRIVTGVRPKGTPALDQARSETPEYAIENGGDFLVVGDPILSAKNPAHAARLIAKEMTEAA